MTRYVVDMQKVDGSSVGPKAASLGHMSDAGLPVPPFVVVSADAYREHAARSGIGSCAGTEPGDGDVTRYREAIVSTPLDPAVRDEVLAAFARLGSGPVAIRSSGTAEDLPGASFAGQHGTYFARDAEEVVAHVADCWASLWTDRAYSYRVRQGIAHETAAMAVIIQTLVAAEAAGVAFTVDPVSGARRVTVESCFGIGEMLVSGRVAPDRRVFLRPELELLDTHVGSKPIALLVGADGCVEEVALGAERAVSAAVSEEVAREVARLALRAEEVIGSPVDIEWAIASGRLWLLQARPITTVASELPAQRYRLTAWSNVNTGEVLPDVVTPMTWSVVGRMATALVEALFGKLGVRCDSARLTTLIGGRAYFNASLLGSAFERMPMPGSGDITSIFGGMPAPPGYTDLPIAPGDVARLSPVRAVLGLPLIAVWLATHSPGRAEREVKRMRAGTDAANARLAGAVDEDALSVETAVLVQSLLEMSDALAFMGVGMVYHAALVDGAKRAFGDDGERLANTLLAGQGGVASAESGLALARLGALGRSDPQLEAALRGSPQWDVVRARLSEAESPAAAAFLREFERFQAEHGHHARGELELGSPRWSERPDEVLGMVAGLLDITTSADLLTSHRERAEQAAVAEADALGRLGPVRRAWFRFVLGQARRGARTRENIKNEGVRLLATTRAALLALGTALAERGALETSDDILFLLWDEVPGVRAGVLDARAPVAQRREAFDRNRALTPPPVVIGEWDGSQAAEHDATEEATELRGLAVASGVSRGRARVIHTLQSGDRVLPGEVLVAPFTDPGWTPYFVPAAGIVVDMGGMLSHGSIIAREYGIPAVVNVGVGTRAINTGDLVEVDGDRGVVRILERNA